jgi:hypothetical protein
MQGLNHFILCIIIIIIIALQLFCRALADFSASM